MAREFSRKFYKSKEWKRCRQYIFNRDYGLCKKCGKPGEEVHHIIWLNPNNIDNTEITLGEENLILLCRDCHVSIHRRSKITNDGLMFDSEGNLVKI